MTAVPAWATRQWGAVRRLVLAATAGGIVAVVFLTSYDPDRDPAVWVLVVGIAVAGAISAVRAASVPLSGDGADGRIPRAVVGPLWADAGCSLALVVVALLLRVVARVTRGAPLDELWIPLVFAVAWMVCWLAGMIVGFTIATVVRFATGAAAPRESAGSGALRAWPIPLLFVAVVGFIPSAVLSLSALDVPQGRFAEFLVHDLEPYSAGEAVIAWATRVFVVLFVVAAAGLVVQRFGAGRRR